MATGYSYYRIVPTDDGRFRAHLYGGDDKLVWFTQAYTRRSTAEAAITFNRAHAASAPLKSY